MHRGKCIGWRLQIILSSWFVVSVVCVTICQGFAGYAETEFYPQLPADLLPLTPTFTVVPEQIDDDLEAKEHYAFPVDYPHLEHYSPIEHGFRVPIRVNRLPTDPLLEHIKWLTVIPLTELNDETDGPFYADLYLYGESGASIVIREFDFRKLMHQTVPQATNCIQQLHSWFGEFERRERRLHVTLSKGKHGSGVGSWISGIGSWMGSLFREEEGISKQQREPAIPWYTVEVTVTNNCQTAANIEIDIVAYLENYEGGSKELSAHAVFPPIFFDQVMRGYCNASIGSAGNGLRYPVHLENGSVVYLPFKQLAGEELHQAFPSCSVHELTEGFGMDPKPWSYAITEVKVSRDEPITLLYGSLKKLAIYPPRSKSLAYYFWEDLGISLPIIERPDSEHIIVRRPNYSSLNHGPLESRYTEVRLDLPLDSYFSPEEMPWFSDLWTAADDNFRIRYSRFTEDGIYPASKEAFHPRDMGDEQKWQLDMEQAYLNRWGDPENIRVKQTAYGRLQLELLDPDREVNLVVGNPYPRYRYMIQPDRYLTFGPRHGDVAAKDRLSHSSHLLGLATQQRSITYWHDPYQPHPFFAVLFDAVGKVLNHHSLGVETVSITAYPHPERSKEVVLAVRLLSYEDIITLRLHLTRRESVSSLFHSEPQAT